MFNPDIVIDTTPEVTYTLVQQNAKASQRVEVESPIGAPKTLKLSHQVEKSGRVSSVVIFQDVIPRTNDWVCVNDFEYDLMKMQLKLQYLPLPGRTDIEDTLDDMWNRLKEFFDDENNRKKFYRKES